MFKTFDVYKTMYMAELLIGFFVFARKFEKRSYFAVRVAAVCVLNLVAAFFFPVKIFNTWYNSFVFIALFSFAMLTAFFCFKESFINILYCGLAAYTMRHLAFQIYGFTTSGIELMFSRLPSDPVSALYGDQSFGAFLTQNGIRWFFFYISIFVIVYLLTFKIFGKHIWQKSSLSVTNSLLLYLSGAALLTDVVLYSFLLYSLESVTVASVLVYIYNILCCLFVFYMMSNAIDMKSLTDELDMVKYLLKIQKENYEEQSKNIELINIRCHDIKHQIHERLDSSSEKYLKDVEDLIDIYDSKIKTGNNEIDIILMQKSLYCAKNDIVFSCMADGKKLSFMEGADIYSLFGNIVDNAIESAERCKDKAHRVIDLSVDSSGNILKIRSSNYYEGEIEFSPDGLPKTTKPDKKFHGFGVKSIRAIVEKYGGSIDFSANDGIFSVCIIMPISK